MVEQTISSTLTIRAAKRSVHSILVVIFSAKVGVVCEVFAKTVVIFICMEIVFIRELLKREIVTMEVLIDVVRLVGVVVALFDELVAVWLSSLLFGFCFAIRRPFLSLSMGEI